MTAKNTSPVKAYSDRLRSLAAVRSIALILALNVLACWLGYLILGGSTLLAEGHEGESWLRPLHGEEFQVSEAVGWYSLLHEASVFFTLPILPFCLLGVLYEWVQLKRLGRLLPA